MGETLKSVRLGEVSVLCACVLSVLGRLASVRRIVMTCRVLFLREDSDNRFHQASDCDSSSIFLVTACIWWF